MEVKSLKYPVIILLSSFFWYFQWNINLGSVSQKTIHPTEDSVYFANDVLPILLKNCAISGCHNERDKTEGIVLTSYHNVMDKENHLVNTNEIKKSKLLSVLNGESYHIMPPPDYPPLSNNEVQMIEKWILQGALNNYQPNLAAIENPSFIQDIKPIIDLYCIRCHAGNEAPANLNLEMEMQITMIANNGDLIDALKGTNNLKRMPSKSSPLPLHLQKTIENWVKNGAQLK